MTPSFYKQLRKHFIQVEEKYDKEQSEVDIIDYFIIGVLNVKTPEKDFSIDVAYTKESDKISHAAMMLTKSDEYVILFNFDELVTALGSVDNSILAIAAHEIGHFLAGHLTEDTANKKVLNHKPEDQLFLISEYKKSESSNVYEAYMNTTLYSLLKGGCQILELEADKIALKFVHFTDLMATHLATLTDNIYTKIEKLNRIKQLRDYVNNPNTIIDREGYELELILYSKEKEKMTFTTGTF